MSINQSIVETHEEEEMTLNPNVKPQEEETKVENLSKEIEEELPSQNDKQKEPLSLTDDNAYGSGTVLEQKSPVAVVPNVLAMGAVIKQPEENEISPRKEEEVKSEEVKEAIQDKILPTEVKLAEVKEDGQDKIAQAEIVEDNDLPDLDDLDEDLDKENEGQQLDALKVAI